MGDEGMRRKAVPWWEAVPWWKTVPWWEQVPGREQATAARRSQENRGDGASGLRSGPMVD